ncbi:MAG TPA: GNAT family N-acetyltransferase [Solirubrobacteraceae bacterium]|nr:GNAT family N-acetyltransferase [Solirubrobacteraceae bacterium]
MSGAGVVWRMRVALEGDALLPPRWPEGVSVRTFRADDAAAVHALLEHGYRQGGGSVAELDTWLPAMIGDSEYDAGLWFLAEAGATLAGVALCWTSAFVKDLVVHESWRRRGLGEALLRHVFTTFARRGATAVELKVDATNAGAIRLYERAGMRAVERART